MTLSLDSLHHSVIIFAGLAYCLSSSHANDMDVVDLGTIEVTAEKRPDYLQTVPISLSVLTPETLDTAGIGSIKDASLRVPNLHITELTARRTSFPFMRGLGSGQGDPVVTTHIDGVPQLTFNTTNIDLVDVERIEFLRGPQGTLYGRNTLGGVINIITRKPTAEKEFDAAAAFGEFSLQRYEVNMGGPLLSESAMLRLSGSFERRDGYTRNQITNSKVDDREAFFGRGQLLIFPSDDLEIIFSAYGEHDRDGGFALADVGDLRNQPFRIANDFEGFTDRNIASPALTLNYYGDAVDFVSISSYEYWDATEESDVDFTGFDLLQRRTEEEQGQVFQELRIKSADGAEIEIGEVGDLEWLMGAAFFYSKFEHDSATINRPALSQRPIDLTDTATYELDDHGIGIFGQTTLTILDRVDVTTGLRYEYEEKQADVDLRAYDLTALAPLPPQIVNKDSFTKDFNALLPRFAVACRVTSEATVYANAAKGFRPGGYNRNIFPEGGLRFDEEESWTYEAGFKSTWFDNRLRLNMAAFYIDWDDMQLDVPIPAQSGRFFLDNVGEARSQGVEVETIARITENLDVFGGIGFTDAEFKDYVDPVTGRDASGNNLPNVPEFTWNAGIEARKSFAGGVDGYLRAELVGVGETAYDSDNTARQNDYVIADFRIGIRRGPLRVEGWVKNAFEEEYVPVAFGIPAQFQQLIPSGFVGVSGPPRAVGMTVRMDF